MGSPLSTLGFFSTPLSNVTPFTYRDGETFLEQLARLRCWIDEVSSTLAANIIAVQTDDEAALASLTAQLNAELLAFVNQWQTELMNLQDQHPALAFDPTNGTSVEPVNVVISRVYDYTRVYAFFADQLDAYEMTAAELDAVQYTARGFDLALAYNANSINATDVATDIPFHVS